MNLIQFLLGFVGIGGVIGLGFLLLHPVGQKLLEAMMKLTVPLLVAAVVMLAGSGFLIWKWTGAAEFAEEETKRADKAETDLKSCQTDLANVTGALETQNAAVEQLKADGDALQRRVDAALKKARGEANQLRREADRIASMEPAGDHCTWALNMHQLIIGKERGAR